MYSFPSTSYTRAPCARWAKNGSPPTPRKARTGELTPPGIYSSARANRACDWAWRMAVMKAALGLFPKGLFERALFGAKYHAGTDVVSLEPALRRFQDILNLVALRFHGRFVQWLEIVNFDDRTFRINVGGRKRH